MKNSSQIQESDHPHNIPNGWIYASIGDVCLELIGGGTPSREKPEYFGGDIIWLTPTEIRKEKINVISNSKEKITKKGFDESSTKIIPQGAVLLTSRATIGAVAIAGCELTTNQGFASLTCSKAIHNLYLAYFLWGNKDLLEYHAKGTTFKEISKSTLRDLSVPLPPLQEQKRIVSKLEELLTKLDSGIEGLKKTQLLVKQYRRSVLKNAFEGKLTQKGRKENVNGNKDATSFLLSISKGLNFVYSLKNNNSDKNQILSTMNNFTDFTSNLFIPKTWCKTTINEICTVVRGASPRPAGSPKYFGGSIPWITVGSLTVDNTPYLFSVSEFVTEEGKKRSRYIDPDTLLLTNSGATLGVPKITKIGGCINDGSVALLGLTEPLKHFLYYFLSYITRRLRTINQGAAQPNLNTGIVRSIVFPFPQKKEQQEIIEQIEYHFSVLNNTELAIQNIIERSKNLRGVILQSAFRGKLVHQDPKDESPEILLQRIKENKSKNESQDIKKKIKSRIKSDRIQRRLI